MKKLFRLMVPGVAVIAMSIGAFAAAPVSASKGTIAFLLSGPDLYYQYGSDGAVAAAKKLGYNVKVYTNPNVQQSVELANVQAAIAAHSVAIDGYSVSLSAETSSIDKAAAAHIPVFLMYGYSHQFLTNKYVVGFEQVNLTAYSKPVGAYVKAHAPAGQVAVITGQLGRGDAEGYQQGFLEGLGCKNVAVFPKNQSFPVKCGKFTVVTSQSGHWLRPDAHAAAATLLAEYPKLKTLFVENEDMAVGAHTAIVNAHKNIFEVSQNGAPYGLAGVKAGWLKASDTCSPSLEGLFSIRFIDKWLHEKAHMGGHLYYSYTKFVTKANVGKAVGWTFYQHPKQVNKWMSAPLLKPVANPPM